MHRRRGRAVVAVWLAIGVVAGDELGQIAATFAANRDKLREYAWRTRTELVLDGQTQAVQLHDVRYDSRGDLQRTLTSEEQVRPRSGKKQRQLEELLQSLRQLIEAYVQPDPRTASRLYADASVWQGDARTEGVTRVQARNVLREGDEVSLWLDSSTRLPRRLQIVTSFGGEPVKAVTEFEALAGGPFYPAQVVLQTEIKEKKLVVTTRSSELRPRIE